MFWRHLVLAAAMILVCAAILSQPPIPQDPAYHLMADRRELLGIPNGRDVLSNIPFAIVGIMGLLTLRRARCRFADPGREKWPYIVLFTGVTLTAIGSSYYHLSPDNARLVWDRLPMTIGFAGLLAAVVSERISPRAGGFVLGAAILVGAASVYYWYSSELKGAGDLRLYGIVQFGSLIAVLLLLMLYPHRYGGTWYLVAGLVTYGAAKILEMRDAEIFAIGGIVSGHSLKHLVAAAGIGCVVMMLLSRSSPESAKATLSNRQRNQT